VNDVGVRAATLDFIAGDRQIDDRTLCPAKSNENGVQDVAAESRTIGDTRGVPPFTEEPLSDPVLRSL